MNSISISGFIKTGSSAVFDMLNEYHLVSSSSPHEFKPFNNGLYEYIFDLQIGAEGKHKLIKSKKLKELSSNRVFWRLTNYLNALTPRLFSKTYCYEKDYPGYRDALVEFIDNLYYIKTGNHSEKTKFFMLKNILTTFIAKIVHSLRTNNVVVFNQLIKPEHIKLLNYLEHTKAIIVYRDPRDQFAEIISKKIVPVQYRDQSRVFRFVSWHKERRKIIESLREQSNLLVINFENLVFAEERTRRLMEQFLSLKSNHYDKNKFFFKDKAKRAVGIYKNIIPPVELQYIEDNLKELLWTGYLTQCRSLEKLR